jgi:hypothetical protein
MLKRQQEAIATPHTQEHAAYYRRLTVPRAWRGCIPGDTSAEIAPLSLLPTNTPEPPQYEEPRTPQLGLGDSAPRSLRSPLYRTSNHFAKRNE